MNTNSLTAKGVCGGPLTKSASSVVVLDVHDLRLIGTWRSDARKTAREIAARRDMRLAKNKKLLSLFGKLELRYTKSLCYSRFKDHESVSAYKVVAKDDHSVALVTVNPIAGKQIVHIHFDGNHYWVPLGSSGLREFFKRVRPNAERIGRKNQALSDTSGYRIYQVQTSGFRFGGISVRKHLSRLAKSSEIRVSD